MEPHEYKRPACTPWGISPCGYYSDEGVADICHVVKGALEKQTYNKAVATMATQMYKQGVAEKGAYLVPAPSHDGEATYTKEIASLIAKASGAILFDVLKCKPHASWYDLKLRSSGDPKEYEALFYLRNGTNVASLADKKVIFVDNVLSTGLTFKIANKLLGGNVIPLVFAYDNSRIILEQFYKEVTVGLSASA